MKKVKTKKYFGQHFLRDIATIDKITSLIRTQCSTAQGLLEIGPGEGVLTSYLKTQYKEFKAVEIDQDLIDNLYLMLKPDQLLEADFLKLPLEGLFPGQFNLVGNFPYNISSQIVFKAIENVSRIPKVIGMFQKEVARRICSKPGTKANGIITILTQLHYHAELMFEIPPQVFEPVPKVESAIILLTRKDKTAEMPLNMKLFKQVVKMGFQQRRKKLRNTLKPLIGNLNLDIFDLRPEQLGVQEFINIANIITNLNNES